MKKKLLLISTVLLLAFSTSFGQGYCSTCEACYGHYYTADFEGFWNDFQSNCGPGSDVTVTIIEQ